MNSHLLRDAPALVSCSGDFDNSCTLQLSDHATEAIRHGRLSVRISQIGRPQTLSDLRVCIRAIAGTVTISFGGPGSTIDIADDVYGIYNFVVWRSSTVDIQSNTTSNGLRAVADLSDIRIGPDCMFSDGILLQSSDQHGIVDLGTGHIVNNRRRFLTIGEHVWVGRQAIVLPDVEVGRGVIVGAGAVITTQVPEFCIVGGVPARVIKSGMTWSRLPDRLDELSTRYVAAQRAEMG